MRYFVDLKTYLLYNNIIFKESRFFAFMNHDKAPKTEKQKLLRAFCIFGTIFLILFYISNQNSVSAWFGKWTSILNPVIIGFVIAYLCNPIYKKFREKFLKKVKKPNLRKAFALIFTYAIVIAIIALLLIIIIPQVISSYNDLSSKFEGYVNAATKWANDIIINSPLLKNDYSDVFDFIDANNVAERITNLISNSGELMKTAVGYMLKYSSNVIIGVKDFFLGFLISIYVLLFKEHLANVTKRIVRSLTSRENYDMLIMRVSHTNKKIGGYITGALIDSLIVALEGLAIFSIFGIPYAPLVAFIIGVTNLIPIFGPFLGAVPTGFIILIADPSKLILYIILIFIIQQIDGNIVAPLILGSKTGLTSLGIIIAITVFGGYFGILGMFIGIPLFAVIYDIIAENTNARLVEIGDPEFPPELEQSENNEKKFILLIKKWIVFTVNTIVKFAKFICNVFRALVKKLKNKSNNKNKK